MTVMLKKNGPDAVAYFGAAAIIGVVMGAWALVGIAGIWIAAFLASSATYDAVGGLVVMGVVLMGTLMARRGLQYRAASRAFQRRSSS